MRAVFLAAHHGWHGRSLRSGAIGDMGMNGIKGIFKVAAVTIRFRTGRSREPFEAFQQALSLNLSLDRRAMLPQRGSRLDQSRHLATDEYRAIDQRHIRRGILARRDQHAGAIRARCGKTPPRFGKQALCALPGCRDLGIRLVSFGRRQIGRLR